MTRPLYLNVVGQPVFAMLDDASADAPVRQTAVMICPPLGWQDVSSYRARREWAHTLADAGYPALRFDLPGTGDSSGGPRDPDLVSAWVATVISVADQLRELAGRRITAVGYGLGGLILYRALSEGACVDDAVLWGVSGRGRAHTRELRAFAGLEQAQRRGPDDTAVADGELLTAGFLLTAETLAGLDGLEVATLPPPDGLRRALLLERDGIAVDATLKATLAAAGTEVSTGAGEGFADMLMAEPQEARFADGVLSELVAWLADGSDAGSVAQPEPAIDPRLRPDDSRAPAWTELESDDGTRIRETALHFEAPQGRLFGVLTEPVGSDEDLCAVLLNAGAQRRVGVNRMWVEIARRWAARGVPTLRVDLEAIGDADGDSTRFSDFGSFYVPEFIEQVTGILDALVERGLPGRFVVLGLCSGAYWSFHTALADERVAAALMLNPRVLVWDGSYRELYASRPSRRIRSSAASSAAWRGLIGSPSAQGRLLRGLVTTVVRRANLLSWVRRARMTRRTRLAIEQELEREFDALRTRGQRGLLLFSAEEPVWEELERGGLLARRDRWPNLEFVTDPQLREGTGANHTLRPLWLQRHVHARLDEALDGELARTRLPGRPGPVARRR